MKLRIKGNTIRLRLTRTEVAEIGAGREVREVTEFSPNSQFSYALQPTVNEVVTAKFENNEMSIFLPQAMSAAWAVNDEVGIEADQDQLKIIIEKDFACLSPRGEEDSDTFEHPMTGQTVC